MLILFGVFAERKANMHVLSDRPGVNRDAGWVICDGAPIERFFIIFRHNCMLTDQRF